MYTVLLMLDSLEARKKANNYGAYPTIGAYVLCLSARVGSVYFIQCSSMRWWLYGAEFLWLLMVTN